MFDFYLALSIGILIFAESPNIEGKTIAQKHSFVYTEMPNSWDEGLPLGNGLLGALIWGDGSPLKISLDRTDLWDLREVSEFNLPEYNFQTMLKWEKEGRYDDLIKLYEDPYNNPAPTKIPAGRLKVAFKENANVKRSTLDISNAIATVEYNNGVLIKVLIHATKPLGIILSEGNSVPEVEILPPPFGKLNNEKNLSKDDLRWLDYPPPKIEKGQNNYSYTQECWGGFEFAIYLEKKEITPTKHLFVWSIESNFESRENSLNRAKRNVISALEDDLESLISSHNKWWEDYWNKTYIHIPDLDIEKRWYHETYKFGASAGPNAITLQGPWTADNGKIPPWKGDYHHDLNTEMSYWIAYSGNRLEQEKHFIDWLWKTKEEAVKWTRKFFNLPGLNVPMTTDILGRQIGGWRQYTHSPTTSAWLAHHFYLHWKYSNDIEFLRERAYPYLKECTIFIDSITKDCRDENGKRKLPLSSSPEINDNKPNAWFQEITNYDLSLIRWLLSACAELAKTLGKDEEKDRWLSILGEFPDLWKTDEEGLLVAKDYPLKESHRHMSHLMAIYPLGILNPHKPEDMQLIKTSLKYLDSLGTSYWCGYSFAWRAILSARAKDHENCIKNLKIFSEAFVLRNSFHCNGDQSGKGYSKFTYRPFTLEGNFASATAIQEMLLQSHNGLIEVYPAVSPEWKYIYFKNLRAEGGFLVSAEKRDNKIKVEITTQTGGNCSLISPKTGEILTLHISPNETKVIEF
ncbi:MAG: glycoside hydrolase N-terminal domain-containing protein [Candidatus Hydrogenedentes bacterium]|nr:glycoside hydrolase N-terminal domain-containing protein [Candidatus Hydrogenedentota bacterium]